MGEHSHPGARFPATKRETSGRRPARSPQDRQRLQRPASWQGGRHRRPGDGGPRGRAARRHPVVGREARPRPGHRQSGSRHRDRAGRGQGQDAHRGGACCPRQVVQGHAHVSAARRCGAPADHADRPAAGLGHGGPRLLEPFLELGGDMALGPGRTAKLTLGRGAQVRHRLAQCRRRGPTEAQTLGHDGRPRGQPWSAVDPDLGMGHPGHGAFPSGRTAHPGRPNRSSQAGRIAVASPLVGLAAPVPRIGGDSEAGSGSCNSAPGTSLLFGVIHVQVPIRVRLVLVIPPRWPAAKHHRAEPGYGFRVLCASARVGE